eukprot:754901-Hanusia_phi.AAC.1
MAVAGPDGTGLEERRRGEPEGQGSRTQGKACDTKHMLFVRQRSALRACKDPSVPVGVPQ